MSALFDDDDPTDEHGDSVSVDSVISREFMLGLAAENDAKLRAARALARTQATLAPPPPRPLEETIALEALPIALGTRPRCYPDDFTGAPSLTRDSFRARIEKVLALCGFNAASVSLGRFKAGCPVCQGGASWNARTTNTLVFELQGERMLARCTSGSGCTAEKLGAEFEKLVGAVEAHLVARGLERQKADQKAEERRILDDCSLVLTESVRQPWVIENVVPDHSLTLLVGASGGGKTFAAMSLGVAVASNTPWLAHAVEGGRVLCVLLEGSEVDLGRRWRALAQGVGTSLEAIRHTLLRYRHPLKTSDPASLDAFVRFVASLKPRLIVIDNLSEIRGEGSENDSAVMSEALRPFAKLAHGEFGCDPVAIVVLHHANASGDIRGSTAIKQHADHVLELDRASDRNDATIRVYRGKSRSGGGIPEFAMRFVDRPDGAIVPEGVTAKREAEPEEKPDDPRRELLLGALPLASEALYAAMHAHKCGRNACKRLRDELEAEGLIEKRGDIWHRIDGATE